MSTYILLLVLLGALLHASWNALVRAQHLTMVGAGLVAVGAAVAAVPLMLLLPMPAAASFPYLAASALIHVGYFALLAFAYRGAELSVAYPLTRGSAPLFTALFAYLLLGEALSLNGWLAVLAIASGVLTLSADAIRRGALGASAGISALMNAAVIVLYTLVDGLGARAAGNGFAYCAWMLFATGALVGMLVLARWRGTALATVRTGWPVALIGGACILGSYGIALFAMTLAPIGLVAALRETSVLFAALLGAYFLKETFGPQRWLALALILVGIALLRVPL